MILFRQHAIVKLCEIIEAVVFKQRWLVYLPIYIYINISISIIKGDMSHTIHVCYAYPKPRVAYHTWIVCFRPPRLIANSIQKRQSMKRSYWLVFMALALMCLGSSGRVNHWFPLIRPY